MELIFASNNAHKLEEIQTLAGSSLTIISLKEAGIFTEIPEPWPTLQQNALQKCQTIYELTGRNCFAEDSGLEVDALNGAPGVLSARFAGEPLNHEANMNLLLSKLEGEAGRGGQFRAVICLINGAEPVYFEGVCRGRISDKQMGTRGFGYDPVFIPDGYSETFAQLGPEVKNALSHRKKAFDKLFLFLTGHR